MTPYFTADGFTLAAPTAATPSAAPFGGRLVAEQEIGTLLAFDYTFVSNGTVLPSNATLFVEARHPVALPPADTARGVCPFYVQVYVDDDWWYFCSTAHAGTVLLPGVYEIDVDWASSPVTPHQVSTGSRLRVLLSSAGTTTEQAPSLSLLFGSPSAPSRLALLGTSEGQTVEQGPAPAPMPTSQESLPPMPDPTRLEGETTQAAPAPLSGLLLAIAALALVVRQRLTPMR